jgi:hypothetical protein
MEKRSFSDAVGMAVSEVVETDTIFVLDKSDISGPQSGPGGTMKQLLVNAVLPFTTIKSKIYNLSLVGIDTTKPLLTYVRDAINAYGPFLGVPGELLIFRTSLVIDSQTAGPVASLNVVNSYFKVTSGDLVVGGPGSPLVPFGLMLDSGPYSVNPESNSSLFIDLGDLNGNAVDIIFNQGDAGLPWVVSLFDNRFIMGVVSGIVNIWTFSGGPGSWGGTPTDPDYMPASIEMFSNLNQQPQTPVDQFVTSTNIGEPVGVDRILNLVSFTQAEYDQAFIDGEIVLTTLYIIIE